MELDTRKRTVLLLGSVIGALLGAGAAWLMLNSPAELEDGEAPAPIKPSDILTLTGAAASLLRMIDDFRRRL